MLVIEAPPGLGKSTLIEQVEARAARELLVLTAAGRELEQELGWGVARSLFEPWLLGLPEDERADLLAGPAASASLLLGPDGDAPGPDLRCQLRDPPRPLLAGRSRGRDPAHAARRRRRALGG